MANVLSQGSLFPPELIPGMINEVKGSSVLAQLSGQGPIAFTGQKEFVFNMDNEVAIVAEGAKKPAQGATVTAKTIRPVKVVYTMRVTDEFMTAGEEYQLGLLEQFGTGFARKLARGLDLMALYGINPFDGSIAKGTVQSSSFAYAAVGAGGGPEEVAGMGKLSKEDADTADAFIEKLIADVQDRGYDVTGLAMSPAIRSDLAALTTKDGAKLYPELAWGSAPSMINGLPVQVGNTMGLKVVPGDETMKLAALTGDFANYFKWGYAKQMPIEVIQYGDPDNTGVDLKGSNQVALRGEAYLGWAILEDKAFSFGITTTAATGN